MSNQTHFIVGTTGSGKTALACLLAKDTPTTLISADSRQVYTGLDVITGKDQPTDIRLFGIDLVAPNHPCSVGLWYQAVAPPIKSALNSGQSIIVVGGTGLYVRALTHGIGTLAVPPNPSLRAVLASLPISALKQQLSILDPHRYHSLNHSDAHNPRRLIRAIEVASSDSFVPVPAILPTTRPWVGLYYSDLSEQEAAIKQRVQKRLAQGALREAEHLRAHYSSSLPIFSALGLTPLLDYLNHTISSSELEQLWVNEEMAYVKRQLTYFRKQNVIWYDRGRMSIEEIYGHLSR